MGERKSGHHPRHKKSITEIFQRYVNTELKSSNFVALFICALSENMAIIGGGRGNQPVGTEENYEISSPNNWSVGPD
jgi:hypothetical protein